MRSVADRAIRWKNRLLSVHDDGAPNEEILYGELRKSIEAGKKAEDFKNTGYYDYALDIIESFAEGKLHELRKARESRDKEVDSLIRWQTAEDLLETFQMTVENSVVNRREAMIELVKLKTENPVITEDFVEQERIREKL